MFNRENIEYIEEWSLRFRKEQIQTFLNVDSF